MINQLVPIQFYMSVGYSIYPTIKLKPTIFLQFSWICALIITNFNISYKLILFFFIDVI